MGLAEMVARLGRFDPEPAQRRALTEAAQRLDQALRQALSEPKAVGRQSEAMRAEPRNSIGHRVEADRAIIGSTSVAAVQQALGNRCAPPRPVLAPLAAELGEPVAQAIGAAAADTIRSALAGRSSF